MKLLVAMILLCGACAHSVESPPPPQPDAGDPCGDCWALCGKVDNQRDAIFCSLHCNEVCAE